MYYDQLKRTVLAIITVFAFSVPCFSQKGIPAPDLTSASVNTNFPQHEDFKESLVSRLKVPAGFEVIVSASGLGKPRMMALNANGALYITRRDVGDVLMLTDNNADGKFDDMQTVFPILMGSTA